MLSILYISYDGVMEPLGRSQVLSYLIRLTSEYRIFLLSFEKDSDKKNIKLFRSTLDELNSSGIIWIPLSYHKRPIIPATLYDVFVGCLVSLFLVFRYRIHIIHVRSYIPALMSLLTRKLFRSCRLIFDIRGFWPDERVDSGAWKRNGANYKIFKRLEKIFFLSSDHIVTLTRASVAEIRNFSYLKGKCIRVTVIPTCADLGLFIPMKGLRSSVFTLGYVGSLGSWYMFDEILYCFKVLVSIIPNSRLLIVTKSDHEVVRAEAKKIGVLENLIEVVSVDHKDVPFQIARMHAAAAIIRPCYSKTASAPTKLAEYLGCGVPCLVNHGYGDVGEIVVSKGVGVALTSFSDSDRSESIQKLIKLAANPATSEKCRNVAEELFSADFGAFKYSEIYSTIYKSSEGL